MREKVSEMMVFEKKITLVEKVSPIVENVQSQAKTLRKEKKCPEELEKDVAAVIYLADVFSIPSFLRVKHQFTFKYGEKYIDKICGKKHTNVDEEIVAMVEYKPESKAVKERAKQVTEDCKKREKEEEKAKKEAEKAKKSGKSSGKSKKHHHKKESSSDESDSDSDSDSSSEEEKPKKKEKKAKKAVSSDSESSEEEKPKEKKEEPKEEPKEEKKEEEPAASA